MNEIEAVNNWVNSLECFAQMDFENLQPDIDLQVDDAHRIKFLLKEYKKNQKKFRKNKEVDFWALYSLEYFTDQESFTNNLLSNEKPVVKELVHYYTIPVNERLMQKIELSVKVTQLGRCYTLVQFLRTIKYQIAELKKEPAKPENLPKINTTLSVAEIGLFLRLLIETEIFPKANKVQTAKTFSSILCSKAKEDVAHKSLNNLIYKSTEATLDSWEEKLKQLSCALSKVRDAQGR